MIQLPIRGILCDIDLDENEFVNVFMPILNQNKSSCLSGL
jgi:hypothetical protein